MVYEGIIAASKRPLKAYKKLIGAYEIVSVSTMQLGQKTSHIIPSNIRYIFFNQEKTLFSIHPNIEFLTLIADNSPNQRVLTN